MLRQLLNMHFFNNKSYPLVPVYLSFFFLEWVTMSTSIDVIIVLPAFKTVTIENVWRMKRQAGIPD